MFSNCLQMMPWMKVKKMSISLTLWSVWLKIRIWKYLNMFFPPLLFKKVMSKSYEPGCFSEYPKCQHFLCLYWIANTRELTGNQGEWEMGTETKVPGQMQPGDVEVHSWRLCPLGWIVDILETQDYPSRTVIFISCWICSNTPSWPCFNGFVLIYAALNQLWREGVSVSKSTAKTFIISVLWHTSS